MLSLIVSLGAAALAAGMAVYFWLRPRNPKRSLEFKSHASAVVMVKLGSEGFAAGVPPRLSLTYDGERVHRCSVTSLELVNTGHTAILAEEVRSPISVSMDAKRLLGEPELASSSARIDESLVTGDSDAGFTFDISFNYLEPGDSITLDLVHDGPANPFAEVRGDIVGIRSGVRSFRQRSAGRDLVSTVGSVIGVIATVGFVVLAIVSGIRQKDPPAAIPPGSPPIADSRCDGEVVFGTVELPSGETGLGAVTFRLPAGSSGCEIRYDLDENWQEVKAMALVVADGASLPEVLATVDDEPTAIDINEDSGDEISIDLIGGRNLVLRVGPNLNDSDLSVVFYSVDFDEYVDQF